MIRLVIRTMNMLQKIAPPPSIQKRVEQLVELKEFTLEESKREIIENFKTSKFEFLTGIQVSAEELDMLKKIANCIKDQELKSSQISIIARKEIAQVVGCDLWEVTKFIILHKSYLKMHAYLLARVKNREAFENVYLEPGI